MSALDGMLHQDIKLPSPPAIAVRILDVVKKDDSSFEELANAKLRDLANRDGLTGLYNHKHFQDVMDKELSGATRYKRHLSLILFDINHFKSVNDRYGHPRGDIVLKTIAEMTKKLVRESDMWPATGAKSSPLS